MKTQLTSDRLGRLFEARAVKVGRVGGTGSRTLAQRLRRLAEYLDARYCRVRESWEVWVLDDEQPNARWGKVGDGHPNRTAGMIAASEYAPHLAVCVLPAGDDPNDH